MDGEQKPTGSGVEGSTDGTMAINTNELKKLRKETEEKTKQLPVTELVRKIEKTKEDRE